jgi:iron-sulfur cluster assembly protein
MSTAINPIKITDKAIKEIKNIISDKEIPSDYGLRVGMQGGGCGGMSFMLGFDKLKDTDGVYEMDDFKVFIEKKDTMYLLGMVVDYIEQEGKQGFTFIKET